MLTIAQMRGIRVTKMTEVSVHDLSPIEVLVDDLIGPAHVKVWISVMVYLKYGIHEIICSHVECVKVPIDVDDI